MNSTTATETGALTRTFTSLPKHTCWHQHEAEREILDSLTMQLEGMEGTDLLTAFEAWIDDRRRELRIESEEEAA